MHVAVSSWTLHNQILLNFPMILLSFFSSARWTNDYSKYNEIHRNTSTQTIVHELTHIRRNMHTYKHTDINKYISYIYEHTHICEFVSMFTFVWNYLWICLFECIYVRSCMPVCVHLWILHNAYLCWLVDFQNIIIDKILT